LRTKEQETRLTLHEHDSDDEEVNVLLEDGPFGPKHVVNEFPLYIINNPYW
jgi:hypothetical protein